MRSRLVAAGALAFAVVALAGCGGGTGGDRLTKDEYQDRGAAVGEQLRDEFQDIEDADTSDLKQVGPLMRRLGEALDRLADEFDELEPPEDVEAAHDRLVSAARTTAGEARAIGERLETETLAELQDDLAELDLSQSEAFRELQEAAEEITSKGYDFGDTFGG